MDGKFLNVGSTTVRQRRSRRRSARRRRWLAAITGLLVLGLAVVAGVQLGVEMPFLSLSELGRLPSPRPLLATVQGTVAPLQGTFGVYARDLRRGRSYGMNEEQVFTAASVNKVVILAALYRRASQGELDLDRTIAVQARDIQDYGSGVLRHSGPGRYSLRELAALMIKRSDNTAAYVLANHLGRSEIQSMADRWGLVHTSMAENKTSPRDIVRLFEKIYRAEVAAAAHSEEMLVLLTDTDFEDRLPKLLPKTVRVAHKIGTEVGVINDAGVVYAPNGPYVLAAFSEQADPDQAVPALARISRLVFDFQSGIR